VAQAKPAASIDARRAGPVTLAVLVGPALLIYAGFAVYPVLRTFWNSVHTIKPQGLEEHKKINNKKKNNTNII